MKISILGLGFMGSTHLKALAGIPHTQLIAVMSSSERKLTGDLSGIRGNIGGPGQVMDFSNVRKYRTVEEVLGDADVEAVDICLPTDQHASVVIAALRAGKDVLVEKPMALDGKSADEMTREAENCGRTLMVAHVLHFFPGYKHLSRLLREGRLGPVRYAFFRRRTAAPRWGKWQTDIGRSGGGVFDLLIHDIDMCLHLFGPPMAVSATGYEDLARGIDTVSADLAYPGIGSVSIAGGWHHLSDYPFSMEFTVTGDLGTLEFNSAGRPCAFYPLGGEALLLDHDEKDPYQAQLEYFIDCATHKRRPKETPPEQSAKAVKLAGLILESRERKGERVRCDL
jgi:predicted dehydrogenase